MSSQDLVSWKEDPITQKLFKCLQKRRTEIGEFLVQGGNLASEHGMIAQARYVGTVDAIDDILTLTVFDADEENIDE